MFGALYFCFTLITGTYKWAPTTLLLVELEHFPGPFPKPQIILNYWILYTQASEGYKKSLYLRRVGMSSLQWTE